MTENKREAFEARNADREHERSQSIEPGKIHQPIYVGRIDERTQIICTKENNGWAVFNAQPGGMKILHFELNDRNLAIEFAVRIVFESRA